MIIRSKDNPRFKDDMERLEFEMRILEILNLAEVYDPEFIYEEQHGREIQEKEQVAEAKDDTELFKACHRCGATSSNDRTFCWVCGEIFVETT